MELVDHDGGFGQQFTRPADASKLVQRLERTLERIPEAAAEHRAVVASQPLEAEQAMSRLGQPFASQAALDAAVGELQVVDEQLAAPDPDDAIPQPEGRGSAAARLSTLTRSSQERGR